MDGSSLVFIVVPVVIPLALVALIALPYIADRSTARGFSAARPARQPDLAPERPAAVVSATRAAVRSPAVPARTYADRHTVPVRSN
jgi:hypothetical protein